MIARSTMTRSAIGHNTRVRNESNTEHKIALAKTGGTTRIGAVLAAMAADIR
jgi:hypothetical protein